MRKKIIAIASLLCVIFSCAGLVGCDETPEEPTPEESSTLVNGGFESADLSGWTVEYGDAFDDDCVSSQRTFMFDNDANHANRRRIGSGCDVFAGELHEYLSCAVDCDSCNRAAIFDCYQPLLCDYGAF